jgi:hypothetical protein
MSPFYVEGDKIFESVRLPYHLLGNAQPIEKEIQGEDRGDKAVRGLLSKIEKEGMSNVET